MKRLTLLAFFCMVSLAPLAFAAETMERPVLQVGDEWAFVVNYAGRDDAGQPLNVSSIGKRIVLANDTLDIAGTRVETLRVVEVTHEVPEGIAPHTLAGAPLDFSGAVTLEWIRVSDGLTVKSLRLREAANGAIIVQGGVRVYPEGCDLFGWPLVVGKDETRTCPLVITERTSIATVEFHPSTNVTAKEHVRVPIGTVEAFVTNMGAEGYVAERQWYAPSVCWRVKAEGLTAPVTMELLGFRCGTRTAGHLNPADPPLDITTLTEPTLPTPGLETLAALGAISIAAAIFTLRRRK